MLRRLLRLLLLVLLLALALAVYVTYRLEHPASRGASGDVTVLFETGTPTSAIFRRLEKEGVVEDARLAEIYYRVHRRATTLQAGEYRFTRPMPIDEVINRMKDRGVLVGITGPHANVIKIRPPLVLAPDEADAIVAALDESLSELAPD